MLPSLSNLRTEHVLLAGLAQQPAVGVDPTYTPRGARSRPQWTVVLKVNRTDPDEGWAYITLKFGKKRIKDIFVYQLARQQTPIVELTGRKLSDEPDSEVYGPDEYFMNLPNDKGTKNFERVVVAKIRRVAKKMIGEVPGVFEPGLPETEKDGFVVFTVTEP